MSRKPRIGVSPTPSDRRRIGNLLGAFVLTAFDGIGVAFRDLDLRTMTDAATLIRIFNKGAQSIGALAKMLEISHSSMVRVADRLSRRGLVTRSRVEEDAREVVLNLTQKGRSLASRALSARNAVLIDIGQSLSAAEIVALKAPLEKLLRRRTTGRGSAIQICRLCDESACVGGTCPVEQAAIETGAS